VRLNAVLGAERLRERFERSAPPRDEHQRATVARQPAREASPMPLDAPVTSATFCAMRDDLRRDDGGLVSTHRPPLTVAGDAPSTPAEIGILTPEEFGAAIDVLAEHHGVERLRERFARMNAFSHDAG